MIDRFIDVFFLLDIILNFFTTFINPLNKLLVSDLRRIALHYILGPRFIVDLLATIPFDEMIPKGGNSNNSTYTKVLGLMKMIRLLRLGRIITFMKLRSDFKIGFRIFQLLFFLLLLAHWIGCIWYIIVNDSKKLWIPPAKGDAPNFFAETTWQKYSKCVYHSILLIIGNEIAPVNNTQTLVASLVVVCGSLFCAFIFGNMASLLSAMNKKEEIFN